MNCLDTFLKQSPYVKNVTGGVLPSGFIGLEIETECPSSEYYSGLIYEDDDDGFSPTEVFAETFPDWTIVGDGSLRNFGVEWVFNKPLGLIQAKSAINSFAEGTKHIPFDQDAPATSVHVHLSILDMTPLQLANFLTLLFMFENVLVEYCGPKRRSNLFALPSRVAQGSYTALLKLLSGINTGAPYPTSFLVEEHNKYAAINLSSLDKLGTVEIRCHPGCTDPVALKRWVDVLVSIRNHAMLGTPSGYLESWESDSESMMHDVFGKNVGYFMFQNYQALVDRNLLSLSTVLYGIEWETFGMKYLDQKAATSKVEVKTMDAETLNSILQHMYDIHEQEQPNV